MRAFPVGFSTPYAVSQAPPTGELVAATPLGKDQDGKNLVAYIVRTEDDAPQTPLRQAGNNNDPRAKQAAINPQQPRPQNKPGTSAQFIKPDDLLSRLERSQLEQLRLRNTDVTTDNEKLSDGAGHDLLPAYVYAKGPDGKQYALGVGKAFTLNDDSKTPEPLARQGASRAYAQAAGAYAHASGQDIAGNKANLLNLGL